MATAVHRRTAAHLLLLLLLVLLLVPASGEHLAVMACQQGFVRALGAHVRWELPHWQLHAGLHTRLHT
jgi:hypothetical protein